jgi:putative protein-disulfide isomerase
MQPILIYCYDAYCGWCYGFSGVINKLAQQYSSQVQVEVVSGGMHIGPYAQPIQKFSNYILNAYKQVQTTTGVAFGTDYLWHLNNPNLTDWVLNSEKCAIALSIIKQQKPNEQLAFATDLQLALFDEGRDLCDNEAYLHLIYKYGLNEKDFFIQLADENFKTAAYNDFDICKKLNAASFPQVFLQDAAGKTYKVAHGYESFEVVSERLEKVL